MFDESKDRETWEFRICTDQKTQSQKPLPEGNSKASPEVPGHDM